MSPLDPSDVRTAACLDQTFAVVRDQRMFLSSIVQRLNAEPGFPITLTFQERALVAVCVSHVLLEYASLDATSGQADRRSGES